MQQEIIRYRIGTKGLELQLEDVLNYKLRLQELGVEYDEQKGEEQVADSEPIDSQAVERKKKGKSN